MTHVEIGIGVHPAGVDYHEARVALGWKVVCLTRSGGPNLCPGRCNGPIPDCMPLSRVCSGEGEVCIPTNLSGQNDRKCGRPSFPQLWTPSTTSEDPKIDIVLSNTPEWVGLDRHNHQHQANAPHQTHGPSLRLSCKVKQGCHTHK